LVRTKPPASEEKCPREHKDEMVEVELEEDDIANDMLGRSQMRRSTW